jgi:hypothetical protein
MKVARNESGRALVVPSGKDYDPFDEEEESDLDTAESMCELSPSRWCNACARCICSPFCLLTFLLVCLAIIAAFCLPHSPFNLVNWADAALESVIEYTAGDMSGVNITLGSLSLGALSAEADLTNVVTSNPLGYTTPYFMRIHSIHADASWVRLFLSSFGFLEINEIQIRGLDMYIQDKILLLGPLSIPTGQTNIGDILKHVRHNPLAKWTAGKLSHMVYTNFKYAIKHINIQDMHIHVMTKGYPNVSVALAQTQVNGLGVKENGVYIDKMISETIKGVSKAALAQVNVKLGGGTIFANGQFE